MRDFMEDVRVDPILAPLPERLRGRPWPLVLWGTGCIGQEVEDYLLGAGIRITDVFVDDEYWREELVFRGRPVLSWRQILAKYPSCDVLVGHADYSRAGEIGRYPNVRGTFFATSVSYQQVQTFPLEKIKALHDMYQDVYVHLGDELSRNCFTAYLSARICDNPEYVWPYAPQRRQSYFLNDVFQVTDHEKYLDVGAYTGDTIEDFLRVSGGQYEAIIGIEADTANFRVLRNRLDKLQLSDIKVFNVGTWKKSGTLALRGVAEAASVCEVEAGESGENGETIRVVALDELLQNETRITVVKVNFLTGVLETLQGAGHLLQRNRPTIIVTVGFNESALAEIPPYLRSVLPDYRFYLRFCQSMPGRLVLYGIPPERVAAGKKSGSQKSQLRFYRLPAP